jgi:HAD superfamily hydrolase (TIGR01509 family)
MTKALPRSLPVDAVIFDLDGTLVESHDAVPAAYISCVRAATGREFTPEDVIALYPVGPPPILLGRLLGRPATADDVAAYHDCLRAQTATARRYPVIPETLAALAARVPLGVFTGAATLGAEIILAETGLRDRFTVVMGSDEVARVKPAPDGILEVCRRLGVSPERAAYVGDSPLDTEAARAAGAVAVAAAWGHLHVAPAAGDGAPLDLVAGTPSDLLSLVATRN